MSERAQKLLTILRKREPTPAMLARIARVEADLQKPTKPIPAPIPVPEPIKKKKKIIEVDED